MPINADVRGMVWDYPDSYVVGREKVREYAKAIKAEDPASFDEDAAAELGYESLLAPLTFVSTIGTLVQRDFFRHVDVGLQTMQIVQVDQKFVYHKPICVGDEVWARMEIQSIDERFGADIVVTRNTLTNDDGELVMESYTTMMGHDGDDSIQIEWDAESGQVVRKAD